MQNLHGNNYKKISPNNEMLNIILAESSLELIPKQMHNHPAVTSYSKKFKKDPSKILLDNSWHFAAMKGVENEIKRGRPDIIHLTLLSICTSPAFYENHISVQVHTINDNVINISNNVRLPKSYHRFQGLMEQLFVEKIIRSSEDDQILMSIEDSNLSHLVDGYDQIIGLTTDAPQKTTFEKFSKLITENTCIIIGGFQKGHFSSNTTNILTKKFRIGTSSLEAHLVASRLVYEYEKNKSPFLFR